MIPLLLASALLLVAVALMVVRPLLAPREEATSPGAGDDAAAAADAVGPPAVDATDRDAVEALIASRRARMERQATGAGS
jgi:hypothetical protein